MVGPCPGLAMISRSISRLRDLARLLTTLRLEALDVGPEPKAVLATAVSDLNAVAEDLAQIERVRQVRGIVHQTESSATADISMEMCRRLIGEGGYSKAFIGIHDDRMGSLLLLGHAGFDGLPEGIPVSPLNARLSEEEAVDPIAQVLRTNLPCVSAIDEHCHAAWQHMAGASGCRFTASLPLRIQGHLGVLTVITSHALPCGDGELGELALLALELGAVRPRPRSPYADDDEEARTGHPDDMALVNSLNHAANRGATIAELMAILCERTRALFGAGGAAAYLISDDGSHMILQNSPLEPQVQQRVEVTIGSRLPHVRIPLQRGGIYEGILRAGRPQLTTDQPTIRGMMAECTTSNILRRLVPTVARLLSYRCVLSVPMVAEGATIGLVDIGRARAFDADEVRRFVIIAEQLATLIHRRRVMDALRVSELRFRELFDAVPIALFRAGRDGVILDANPALVAMLGFATHEALLGQNVFECLIEPADRERCETLLESEGRVAGFEARMRRRDGAEIWVRQSIRVIRRNDIQRLEGSVEDITESRLMACRLEDARRMESIGRLAGGIAHDFNNLLQVVLGYSDILGAKIAAEHPFHAGIRHIHEAGTRAQSLVRQLLAFSRRQLIQPRSIDLNGLVLHQKSILGPVFGEQFALCVDLEAELWHVRVDPSQIEGVIATLLTNAGQAMPEGGALTVRTWNARFSADDTRRDPRIRQGEFVALSVADSGAGMSPEAVQHVFEPFFATDEPGNRGGLGLAVAHGAVTQHGGWIFVESASGQGTVFSLFLPACHDGLDAPAETLSEGSAPHGSGEGVLVVEDEDTVRAMAVRTLRERGYLVFEASTCGDATAQFYDHGSEVSLVFSDIVLPDGSGMDLALRLKALHPSLRLLLTSGYVEGSAHDQLAGTQEFTFIPKPYGIEAMVGAVYSSLHQREADASSHSIPTA